MGPLPSLGLRASRLRLAPLENHFRPLCWGQTQYACPGSLNYAVISLGPVLTIYDKRARSANQSVTHNVYTIKTSQYWGSNVENYYFGAWWDDTFCAWKPLGLVGWERFDGGNLIGQSFPSFLVDCNAWVPCYNMPDP